MSLTSRPYELSARACRRLLDWFEEDSGIRLAEGKRTLVASRLRKRLVALELPDFDAYCDYVERQGGRDERRRLVDLLTTNETYFFREPTHFDFLATALRAEPEGRAQRVWSAACSSGEEAYSLAMTLSEHARGAWEILATDLSTRMLERTRSGLYEAKRLENIPSGYLRRYFLRGTGRYEGHVLIQRDLRARVATARHNLLEDGRGLGRFDVIFLRNVLIYFDPDAKARILARVVGQLAPGGLLFLGHSDAMQAGGLPIVRVAKSVFRREDAT